MATYKPKKKIDNNGTLDDIKFPMDSIYGLSDEFKKKGVHFISKSDINVQLGSRTKTERWTVSGVDGITVPFDGMVIAIRMPSRGSYRGVALSLDGGATYSPLLISNATYNAKLYNSYKTNATVVFTFNVDTEYTVYLEDDVASTIIGCWEVADKYEDYLVQQTNSSANEEDPVLTKADAGSYSTQGGQTRFNPNVTINHSTGTLSALALKENGVSLEEKYALKDEVGGETIGVDKIAKIGIDDGSFGDVFVDSSNVEYDTYHFIADDSGNTIGGFTMKNNSPFRAGDGIKFENNNAYGIKISTDLPTVQAGLKDASEVGGGGVDLSNIRINYIDETYGDITDVYVDETGIHASYIDTELEIESCNHTHYYAPTVHTKVPIVAGENIEFENDTTNNVVKINSTVEAPINMFVATTEQEFNSLITIENVGKAISYNKKMYLVVTDNIGPNPPKVGDVITGLYFNTNISPDLNSVTTYPINIVQEDGSKRLLVYNTGERGLLVYRIFSSGSATVYRSTSGWMVDHFIFEQPLTVGGTEEEDTWSNFISKTPFGDFATVVEICVGEIPKKTSQLENDSDFATNSSVDEKIEGLATVAISGSYNDLSDKPAIPTSTSQLTNNSDFATNTSVDTKIANLVDSAPEALNTLGELATALENHEDEYDALLEVIGNKADKNEIKALVANTQEEFDALIVEENAGKIVSYGGDLYVVSAKKNLVTPQVGDVLTALYFDTSVTPNFEGYSRNVLFILGKFAGSDDDMAVLYGMKAPSQWQMGVGISLDEGVYLWSEARGWYADYFAIDNATVTVLDHEEFWQGWVSKEPITTTIEAVKVGGSEYPQEWQTGTSGSIVLPSTGRYELVAETGTYAGSFIITTTIYWGGGSRETISPSCCVYDDGMWDWYFSVSSAGVLGLNLIIGGSHHQSDTRTDIQYRKIGKA